MSETKGMTMLERKALCRIRELLQEARSATYHHNFSKQIREKLDQPDMIWLKGQLQGELTKCSELIGQAEGWLAALQEK